MPNAIPKPPRSIVLLVGCIGLLAVGGAYDALIADTQLVDLQAELAQGFTLPALFSGLLLFGVAWFSFRLARGRGDDGVPRWVWGIFVLAFIEAGLDEMVGIHEALGNATGVDWMALYLPLFAIAGVLWLIVLRKLWGRPELLLWVGGAAAWVFAQMLEVYAYGGRPDDNPRPGAGATGAVEEILEMTGSLLLLWTVLALCRRSGEARPPQAEGESPTTVALDDAGRFAQSRARRRRERSHA
jgi:hypothetical protein